MKTYHFLFLVLIFFCIQIFVPRKTQAIVDPIVSQNNKFGIHILFPSELENAAKLVNSSGGDWGYVTIPIPAGDKDLVKWQKFMDDAKRLHVIPIIRLATEGDYFTEGVWKKPSYATVLDFSNFLNSLDWPTLNRYVVIFNEPNRADEWGGAPDPLEYVNILSYAVNAFKSKNEEFFIISAGLDNASANIQGQSINEYSFMQEMNSNVPGIFNQIDGLASHSYPNPGFSQPPWVLTRISIGSFEYERRFAETLGNKSLPVFITETGWSKDSLTEPQIASYLTKAFESAWSDNNIVAVTPFLLQAGVGPFEKFSFLGDDGKENDEYKALKEIPKIKGDPILSQEKTFNLTDDVMNKSLPFKDFSNVKRYGGNSAAKSQTSTAVKLVKWLLKI